MYHRRREDYTTPKEPGRQYRSNVPHQERRKHVLPKLKYDPRDSLSQVFDSLGDDRKQGPYERSQKNDKECRYSESHTIDRACIITMFTRRGRDRHYPAVNQSETSKMSTVSEYMDAVHGSVVRLYSDLLGISV